MILDYEETTRLLKGTPLESLTDEQLKDAFIGEFPITHGSNQFARRWRNISKDELIKFDLMAHPFQELMNRWHNVLAKDPKKNEDKLFLIERSREFVVGAKMAFQDNVAQKGLIQDCSHGFLKYEMENRKEKLEKVNLKENLEDCFVKIEELEKELETLKNQLR